MAEIIVNDNNFDEKVLGSPIPVLVDFWAEWCGPCMMLSPVLSELAKEKEGLVTIAKVNVDECPRLCASYGIASIPTVLLFKEGKLCATSIGLRPKFMFEEMIK